MTVQFRLKNFSIDGDEHNLDFGISELLALGASTNTLTALASSSQTQ
jgi:hypothetical protein